MTNKEILKKIIDRVSGKIPYIDFIQPSHMDMLDDWLRVRGHYALIFSHDFAKAFWGEDGCYMQETWTITQEPFRCESNSLEEWEYHLQIMVLEENPLTYLSKFL